MSNNFHRCIVLTTITSSKKEIKKKLFYTFCFLYFWNGKKICGRSSRSFSLYFYSWNESQTSNKLFLFVRSVDGSLNFIFLSYIISLLHARSFNTHYILSHRWLFLSSSICIWFSFDWLTDTRSEIITEIIFKQKRIICNII